MPQRSENFLVEGSGFFYGFLRPMVFNTSANLFAVFGPFVFVREILNALKFGFFLSGFDLFFEDLAVFASGLFTISHSDWIIY